MHKFVAMVAQRRYLAGLILTLVLIAGGTGLFYRNQAVTTKFCARPGLTDAEVAAHRGIDPATLNLLHTQRGLTSAEVCVMPEARLQRAITRSTHPKPDRPDEAVAFRRLQQQDENGFVPPDGLEKAAEHIEQMRAAAASEIPPAADIARETWTWIGPGNIGGRVRTLVVHPSNPQRMWTGSVSGGIWYSSDGGVAWEPIDDFMANLAVSTMVMHPANPDLMFAGTGEGFFNIDAIQGAGVFRSADGGVTWSQIPATATSNWFYVNRLAISPNGATMLAATNSGIWRSTDGGTSWTQVYNQRTLDIDFHPSNSNQAVAGRDNSPNVLYSTNGGANWTAATGIPTTGRVETAYAPSNPTIVYASANRNNGEVWRSSDSGQSYTLVNSGNAYLGSQGWYDNIVWVDPTNPNTLIVGGIDLWRSTNGGATLTKISTWWNAPSSAHADHHDIVAHPQFDGVNNRTVFFGNDGGVYRADNVYTVGNDIPNSISGWQELNNNLGITQFYGAAGNPATGVIVGGTQDNGTLRYTGDAEGWSTMFGGDGGFSAADPANPNYFYGEYVYAQVHRSSDGGANAEYICGQYWNGAAWVWKSAPYLITDARDFRANFIAPFIIDPNNASRLLVGGWSLWRTNDARTPNTNTTGPGWTAIKAPSNNSPISAIAVAPGNSDIIWVGHNNGDVYRTANGTAATPTWTRVDTGTPNLPNRYVMRLTINPTNSSIVYATFGGFSPDNVWRTADNGATWSDRTGGGLTGLPDAPVRSLVINPDNPNWLYVGTEVGIFASEDAGVTWKLPHDGPANVSVDELFWMNRTLVAATHGRGLYRTILDVALDAQAITWREVAGNMNGAIDPGETIGVQISVANQGNRTANGVSGQLASTGGNVTLLNAASTYPSLAFNAAAVNATEYTLTVNPAQACNRDLSFTHTVTYNSGQSFSHAVTLPIGVRTTTNYAYTGPPAAIIDNGTINIPLAIAGSDLIEDIDVRLDIVHTWVGDLNISLIAPNGTAIDLSSGNGGSGDNYTGTIFDDEAALSIINGAPPFTGRFRPEGALAILDGQARNGNWTLRVQDTFPGDTGQVTGWSMDFTAATCTLYTPAPAVSLNPSGSLNFGSVAVGTASPAQTVTLLNSGDAALTINSISASGDFAQTNACPSSLAAGANCTISVVFQPAGAGALSGSLSVVSNAAGSPHTISLSGVGSAPAVSLNPSGSLDFGSIAVGTASPAQTVTLLNSGDAALTINSISASGDFAQTNACPSSLAAGANCTISVVFQPTAAGLRNGTLTIEGNAPGAPYLLSLAGLGSVTPVAEPARIYMPMVIR